MSKELRPLTSTLCKQRHQEYVDYIERSTLTKETEVDTSLVIKDSDEFYRKIEHIWGAKTRKEARI